MDRVGVFIDAGYLFAQGSVLLAGKKLPRGESVLDGAKMIEVVETFAKRATGLPLLRIYWYDGTSAGPTKQHLKLAYLPGLKLRLGFLNSMGEQKGVDSLIVTDMIALARNDAIAEAVLISGDEDLRVGVQQAQEHGTRDHLVGIKPARGSQSSFLLQEADATYEWGEADISPFLSLREPRATVPVAESLVGTHIDLSEPRDVLQVVADAVAATIDASQLATTIAEARESGAVAKDLHAKLLTKSRRTLGRDLVSEEKRELKRLFLESCEARSALAVGESPFSA